MTAADLRARRQALGFSPYLLAEILHLPPHVVTDWENGTRPIDDPEFLNLALDALLSAHQSSSPTCTMVMFEGMI